MVVVRVFLVVVAFGFICVAAVFPSSSAIANVVGADTQNFNPTTSGLDFVTVQSSETLKPGVLNFGYFINYAKNTLPNYENVRGQRDYLTSADINFGYGLTNHWDFGFSFPQVYDQSVEDDNSVFRGQFAQTGMTEIRFNTKYRVRGTDSGGVALVLSANFNQIKNNPFTGEDSDPSVNVEIAYDETVGVYNLGINMGYRFRNPGKQVSGVPVEPFDDQYIASLAGSFLQEKHNLKWIGEILGSAPAKPQSANTDRELSTLELLLGLKKDWSHNLAMHFGVGKEIIHGSASPDFRVYTGLNYTFSLVKQKSRLTKKITPKAEVLIPEASPKEEVFVTRNLLFNSNSSKVNPEFSELLAELTAQIKAGGNFVKIVVEGHTDSVGSAEYNLELSRKRAAQVADILIRVAELPGEKVEVVGLGETSPIASNGNFQGRAANRRVEFRIIRY